VKQTGAKVIWRCHIGAEQPNDYVKQAWDFLAPYLASADACVFSRRAYVPSWAVTVRTEIIQPSIDALSPKNEPMDTGTARAILTQTGLVDAPPPLGAGTSFTRQDGTPGRVDRRSNLITAGPPSAFEVPLVVQVSRWDRLKDPIGVMRGFASSPADRTRAHLVLAGPEVQAVADDPEGAEVLGEVERAWHELPEARRCRVHLACLPMVDLEENAAIVNALQRHAAIVVQKSIQEGFGLTVAEAMWKARPVIASAVGGIKDQIEDGVSGMLLSDPSDLAAFGECVSALLEDAARARALGERAQERVREHFLLDRHAVQYVELLESIL
jgi:trehalose synthase